MGWCVPVESPHAPLGSADAVVGIQIDERWVDIFPLAVHHNRIRGNRDLAADRSDAPFSHQQGGILQRRLSIAHDRGVCKSVGDVALVSDTIQRERWLRGRPNGAQQSP